MGTADPILIKIIMHTELIWWTHTRTSPWGLYPLYWVDHSSVMMCGQTLSCGLPSFPRLLSLHFKLCIFTPLLNMYYLKVHDKCKNQLVLHADEDQITLVCCVTIRHLSFRLIGSGHLYATLVRFCCCFFFLRHSIKCFQISKRDHLHRSQGVMLAILWMKLT